MDQKQNLDVVDLEEGQNNEQNVRKILKFPQFLFPYFHL
jgi:hypothetical protein